MNLNAGSPPVAGERAAEAIAGARLSVANLINAAPSEIIFTSEATEANNLALFGVAGSAIQSRRRIVVSAIEHKAVLEPAEQLTASGFELSIAPVDAHGRLDLNSFAGLMGDDVLLTSIMAANNETGVLQPIAEAAAIAHRHGALVHCDGAQAVGKIPIDVLALDVDFLSISAHKLYGPVGTGALYAAAGTPPLTPQVFGGGQQNGRRPGTEAAPLLAGFGAAAREAIAHLAAAETTGDRATLLLKELVSRQVRMTRITGSHPVVPGSVAIQLHGVNADSLCLSVGKQLCISTGSACNSGQLRSSHVLESMSFSEENAAEVIRILCPHTTRGALTSFKRQPTAPEKL
ncbi:cysteine desulfurase family protein [Sphingomonas nostoxanthinifaciens]|uniref:cysteine desulfurase family protein n=1 Tax=Sphingomonas nostoxanthinifaciens TaxID=2872652 RepID=UPI002955B2EA|nr:cysteine desulfurase family protein [Sphingomonas nostoxanthinifaciens]UAK26504.1 cysteine desulfurase [Sphingomonas nostoxanthinifaciens]